MSPVPNPGQHPGRTSGSDSTRLRIVHRTGFHYDGLVTASYNEARMTPLNTSSQALLAARVTVDPVTWTYGYRDYWDTQVTAFDVLVPHAVLEVVSSSTVELSAVSPPREAGWEAVRDDANTDLNSEFLPQTDATMPPDEVTELARSAAGSLAPDRAARAVCEALRSQLEYVPGSTNVSTPAIEVWREKKGVCQDFAHVTLGALRTLGIPARYVSGYLHPKADAQIGEIVPGQSHAGSSGGPGTGLDSIRPA